jgi:hypothetical protein
MQAPRYALTGEVRPAGTPLGERRNLRAADWFFRSKAASVIWLVARLWLGYGWLNAGYLGLDRFVLPMMRDRFRPGPRMVTPVASPPPTAHRRRRRDRDRIRRPPCSRGDARDVHAA